MKQVTYPYFLTGSPFQMVCKLSSYSQHFFSEGMGGILIEFKQYTIFSSNKYFKWLVDYLFPKVISFPEGHRFRSC